MERYLLAYLFACFSVGLACLGVTLAVVLRTGSRLARAFLAFYLALSVSVFASLLLAFVEVLPTPVAPRTRAGLEYLEAIVGFYGVLFTLPYLAHRVFAVRDASRDRILAAVVGTAAAIQHVTEYGLGPVWDARGDLFENLVFVAVMVYTLWLGVSRMSAAGVDRPLALRFLVLGVLAIPGVLHDLFLFDRTTVPVYPLLYCGFSVIAAWTLFRRPGRLTDAAVPAEWSLSAREAEVARLVVRGLSNKEIAGELNISSNTVKTHLRAIFDKSGCRSRFALMSALIGAGADPRVRGITAN